MQTTDICWHCLCPLAGTTVRKLHLLSFLNLLVPVRVAWILGMKNMAERCGELNCKKGQLQKHTKLNFSSTNWLNASRYGPNLILIREKGKTSKFSLPKILLQALRKGTDGHIEAFQATERHAASEDGFGPTGRQLLA